MSDLSRNPDQAARAQYDVIIIGGGIYGTMLLLESVRAGLKSLLLEKADFGAGTSFNNLRIVHGGLRYLQTLHLSRIRESVSERSWFLRNYPDLVRPLPCLMPLYGGLSRRPLVLHTALRINDWLSRNRNDDLVEAQQLPKGRMLSAAELRRHFPLVRPEGLRGAALWYDAVMPDCHRLLIETLRWAAAGGAVAINYMDVTGLVITDNKVKGVYASDVLANRQFEFAATTVINAAGPWSRALSGRLGREQPDLFRPSLAWNLLLDRAPLAGGAVAVQSPEKGSRVYFVHSMAGKALAGTGHAPAPNDSVDAPSLPHIDGMLQDLNRAVPQLELGRRDILRVFSGRLPVTQPGTIKLSDAPAIIDHRHAGGPAGLFSVSGVKYTTARSTAARLVSMLVAGSGTQASHGLPQRPEGNDYALHPADCASQAERLRRARRLIHCEAPQSLADLLFRRSNLITDPRAARAIAEDCCTAFGWAPAERDRQLSRLDKKLRHPAASEFGPPGAET